MIFPRRPGRLLPRVHLLIGAFLVFSWFLVGAVTFAAPIDNTDDEEAVIFGGRAPGSTATGPNTERPSPQPPGPGPSAPKPTPSPSFRPISSSAAISTGPDLIYSSDDLILGTADAISPLSSEDLQAALKRLLGKNAWLAPLLKIDTKNGRDLLEKILLVESTVKSIDWKSLKGFRRKLQQQEFNQLWRLMQVFGVRRLGATDFRNLQKVAGTIDMLKQLATRSGERDQLDRLSFALAQTQELLSRNAPSKAEARQFKQQALQNYRGILRNRQTQPPTGTGPKRNEPTQSVESSDVQTRIYTLEQNFGGVPPLLAPAGKNVIMTSDLGYRIHPVTKKRRMHRGVDFANVGCLGWSIQAIGPGRVIKSGWENGYGNVVIVLHDVEGERLFTRYAHLKTEGRARTGTVVPKGAILGKCNNSGVSTASHLHFEVRANSEFGQVIDPKSILSRTGSGEEP